MRRATKLHSTLTKRRTTALARLDALLQILGPDWHAALNGDLANKTPLRVLAVGYADPNTVKRIGRARLARIFPASLPLRTQGVQLGDEPVVRAQRGGFVM